MSSNPIMRLVRSCAPIIGFLRRLRADKSGVAAIEFALIAPLMFFMLVGTVEMSQAITVDRRVTLVASSTADLVAREKAVFKADIDTIMQIVNVLFSPYDAGPLDPDGVAEPLKITLVAVGAKVDDEKLARVCWSYKYHGGVGSYAINDLYALPDGIVEKGGSVIVAEVSYKYTPLIFSYFIKSAFPLTDKFYLKPRISSSVDYENVKRDSTGSCWPP
jgi:Flp pilus assembly pilin Flp